MPLTISDKTAVTKTKTARILVTWYKFTSAVWRKRESQSLY